MLRLLRSNQPAAWVIVPLTAVLLWGLASMGVGGSGPDAGEGLGFIAILASARMIHMAHLESRMKTRPTSIPGWVFVLWAVPLLPGSSFRLWWSGFFVLAALRHALRLPEEESGRNPAFFWMGAHLGLAGLMWPSMALWGLLLPLGCVGLRPFHPAETLSLLLGFGVSWGVLPTLLWLLRIPLPSWDGPSVMHWEPMFLLPWLAFGMTGWLLRQQSLARATARQRNARRLTQWVSAAGLLLGAAGVMEWTGPDGAHQAFFSGGLFCAWTIGWCFPPRWKGTQWVPWALLLVSFAVANRPWLSAA
jgi:hypothetical protein